MLRRTAAICLLFAAIAQLAYRLGHHRAEVPLWDFASVYSSTRVWLDGRDPYDSRAVRAEWLAASPWPTDQKAIAGWTAAYPPTTLILLVPLAMLPVPLALAAWAVLSWTIAAFAFAALCGLAGLDSRDSRTWLLAGGLLAATPLQFALRCGQPTLLAASMTIIAIAWIARGREKRAGVLLGIACALKPHVVLPFIIYYVARRRWRAADAAVLTLCAVCVVAMTAMQVTHIDWMHEWVLNLSAADARGGINDPSPGGPYRDEIVDLQVLLTALRMHSAIIRLMAGCAFAALTALYVRAYARGERNGAATSDSEHHPSHAGRPATDLLPVAALAALSLMPVYHRVYDALILALPFAWALGEWDGPRRRFARAAVIPLTIFLIPLNVLNSIAVRVPSVSEFATKWWWDVLVVPHYSWAALALTVLLLWTLSSEKQPHVSS